MPKTHENVYHEEPVFIRASQGNSGNNLDTPTISRTKTEEGCAPLLYHIGGSRHEESWRTFVRRVWTEQRQEGSVCCALVSPLDQNPDPEVQTVSPFAGTSCMLFMFLIHLESAHKSLDFHQTTNGWCRMLRHSSGQVLHQGSSASRLDTERSRRDHSTPRDTSGHKSENPTTISFETAGIIAHCEVYVQCNWCTKNSSTGTKFCRCGIQLGGLPELQERNVRTMIARCS